MADDKLELLLSGRRYKKLQEVFFGALMEEYGLAMADIRILLFLYEHDQMDTARDIAANHVLAKSYVSKSVEKLIEKGYLESRHREGDKRCVHLAVQEQAYPVIEAASERKKKMLQKIFDGVTEEQKSALREIAAAINQNWSYVKI